MTRVFRHVLALTFLVLVGAAAPVLAQQTRPAASAPAAAAPVPPPAPVAVAPPAPRSETAEKLARGRADLIRVEKSLERADLADSALQALRADIEPIARVAREVLDELAPRIAGVKTRLEQLGPKPDDKAAAENEAVTAERKQQQQVHDALDAELKQARLLAVDADAVNDKIVSRRRAMFARAVFNRSFSILDVGLWTNVVREIPADAQATFTIFSDWIGGAGRRLGIVYGVAFLIFLGFIVAFYVYAARMAGKLLARTSTNPEPSRLARVLEAFLVAAVTALVPIVCAYVISGSLHIFGLVPERMNPLVQSLVSAVTRIAITLGLARGLLALGRPNWRLFDLRDVTCERLARLAVTIAIIASVGKFFDALYDLIAASLPVAVATRGLVTWAVAIVMALSLRQILPAEADDEDCLGPKVDGAIDWMSALRIAAWGYIALTFGTVLIGYVAFGAFLVDQLVWVSFVGTLVYLVRQLADEGIVTQMQPHALVGRGLVTSVGLGREKLALIKVLATGIASLVLWAITALLVLAPWGIESDDMFGSVQSAFFGFRIGEVTISPSSIVLAVVIFGVVIGATRSLQNWLETNLLPHTGLDTGLRNSIRTVLGYIGTILATALALGQIGLDFQKLAIVAGALSVGIGFGLQSIVNNFVSGLIILWERAIRVGDWVIVGDEQGHVKRINVRSTEIETFDRATMIVPNSNLVSGVVKNWVRGDKIGRLRIQLAVPMNTDPELVRDTLLACARGHDLVLRNPAPQVWLSSIGTADLKFELAAFVADVETSGRTKSDLNFEILRRFREANVPLAPAAPPPAVVNINGLERLERLVDSGGR